MPDKVKKRVVEGGAEAKVCAACGRTMEWRKSWAKKLEAAILRLLGERGAGKTICPSEAARAVAGEEREAWEGLMEPARAAGRRLVAEGKIVITQGGRVVDGSTAKGAIRLRLRS